MADTSSTGSQSAKKDNWIDHVTLEPFDKLKLTEGSRAKVGIVNKSPRRISYKVKTTRYYSVMPNRTYGMIDPFGSACIRIAFKPRKNERPFGKNDRITVLLKAVPEANSVSHAFDLGGSGLVWMEGYRKYGNAPTINYLYLLESQAACFAIGERSEGRTRAEAAFNRIEEEKAVASAAALLRWQVPCESESIALENAADGATRSARLVIRFVIWSGRIRVACIL